MKLRSVLICIFISKCLFLMGIGNDSYLKEQPFYRKGSALEKSDSDFQFTLLDLDFSSIDIEKIASEDKDLLFIKSIENDNIDCLYDRLRDQYAHFIFLPTLAQGWMLIVSKYPIEQPASNQFDERVKINEDLLNFVITNSLEPLANIYVIHLKKNSLEEIAALEFQDIVEKMHYDFGDKDIPFFLYADVTILNGQEELNDSCMNPTPLAFKTFYIDIFSRYETLNPLNENDANDLAPFTSPTSTRSSG
jgi:hypothetical protein